jgi:hypothetical protein
MAQTRDQKMGWMAEMGRKADRKNPNTERALELMKKDPNLGKGRAEVKAHQELAAEQAKKSR